ncbi:MAG: glycosyl hydrolase 115 family protein [candidate division KSB1 bacterium]|nr:glycosyl hydrolase 115 family protein [candidate division KSB1 bacterium]MDZ7302555.1 glycosyl hydrolase 115 family protein [candidate division KSB1 bacterium]MDZ7310679.1 glycosyl hydrolase 115 family protein [candidate division KSB1 bacterium]
MKLFNSFAPNRFALLFVGFVQAVSQPVFAFNDVSYISTKNGKGYFPLSVSSKSAPLYASSQDHPGVLRVLKHLQADIARVTNAPPEISTDKLPAAKEIVLIGTLGRNPVIDALVQDKKLDVNGIAGKWEAFLIQVIEKPLPNLDRALIIAGSDKRGTIFGMYDLAAQIGVSPWYWWADVPVKKKSKIYIRPGRHTLGEPAVKYRGIFINDENPALLGWVNKTFGGFNHHFYEKVFELILRLKGNFLWPAMWGKAFYDDDSLNAPLADEYGVVISTSHHEPMMRAHVEWQRYGSGPWNYEKNEAKLREFWTAGIKRMKNYESIVTLAMRGDGDEPMTEEANIALLQRIVKDQREILSEVTRKDVTSIPQVWALYKEVQEYYDKGMRVPDDVTLLLCDDNWGNIRKLPQRDEKPRAGGYGIYYHYDYVGGPRNYKWLNTNQISRVWEQMHLAYRYGATRIWIVNVGDIKPMEFPIEFFLDYAWNPEQWPAERLPEYTELWAKRQFGAKYAKDIADILTKYTKYNSRRKPELLAPDTYSLVNYREAETVVAEYNELAARAQRISDSLPAEYKDAFYQLVLHPVQACSNLNELYVTVGKNRLYAQQGRAATNALAEKARALFKKDAEITHYYNNVMAGGKWAHMMDQTHIGYTYWQQPDSNVMPEVKEIEIPVAAEMGVAIEGSTHWWPNEKSDAVLPEFDPYHQQTYYLEIFNRGQTPFEYSVQAGAPWVKIDKPIGRIETEERLWISVDWKNAPMGAHRVPITVAGPNDSRVVVQAMINNPSSPKRDELIGFVESNGYVSIEAEHFTRNVAQASPPASADKMSALHWQRIPNLGRTLSAMTPFPVTAPPQTPEGNSPRLEYQIHFFSKGEVKVKAYLSPTLNFHNNQGLRYAISFDDELPQIINMHANKTFQDWEESVRNNVTVAVSKHVLNEPGKHVLKFWMVDPGVVLQKLVIETGKVKPSYLGPPESYHRVEGKYY